jgi:hypothetical protein
MFEGTHGPSDPDHQRISFYLYSADLAALRERLLAARMAAPAPRSRCGWKIPTATPSSSRRPTSPD